MQVFSNSNFKALMTSTPLLTKKKLCISLDTLNNELELRKKYQTINTRKNLKALKIKSSMQETQALQIGIYLVITEAR